MIFEFLLVYIIICTLMYVSNRKHTILYLIAVFIPLAFFMGARSTNVGIDTEGYYDLFEYSKLQPWSYLLSEKYHYGAETGYLCLNKLFSYISKDYYHFQLLQAFLYCAGFAKFVNRDTRMPVIGLSVFLGFGLYFQAFNISRQMFVIMLSALMYPLLRSKQYKHRIIASICIILLANLHTTAYLLFIIILIEFLPKAFEKGLPFFILIFIFFFSQTIELSSQFFEKYENYYEGNANHVFTIGISSIIYIATIVLSLMFYYRKDVTHTERINAFFSVIAITCIFLGLQFNYMERIGLIFMPYTMLTFNSIGNKINDRKLKNLYVVGITSVMLLFFYLRIPLNYSFYF